MPPKILYGKKKASRPQTSFTKFLSPEKDVGLPKEKKPACQEQDWWQQCLDDVEGGERGDAEVAAVPDMFLENLRIEEIEKAEGAARTQKPVKLQKNRHDYESIEGKEKENMEYTDLELGMGALTIDCPPEEVGRRKRGRPKKALKDQSAAELDGNRTRDVHGEPNKKYAGFRSAVIRSDKATPKRKPKGTTAKVSVPQHLPLLPTPEAIPELDIYCAYASPLLSLGDRKRIISFQDWSSALEPHFEITKIAEASFSEVYRLSVSSSTTSVKEESVLKVVALKTPPNAHLPCQAQARAIRDLDSQMTKEAAEREDKDQWKSCVADVLSEVKLLQNLNHIPGFTVFRDLTIVQGRPSVSFNRAWTTWNKSRPRGKKSEFPDPSKKTSYDDLQLWAVVEMQDAGTDCEKLMEMGGLVSIWQVWDVFWGVCLSVAKAEEACRFEHRDLHLGNICVRSSRPESDVLDTRVKDPLRLKFRFTGLETTVIDYTLSRADIITASLSRRSSSSSSPTVSETSLSLNSAIEITDVAYLDLNKDPALFGGDASEEYQYEIYRYMRGAALYDNPLQFEPSPDVHAPSTPRRSPRKNTHIRFDEEDAPRRSPRKSTLPEAKSEEENPDIWRAFYPKTNLVWAHFLLHKLMNHLQYHSAVPDELSPKQVMHSIELEDGDAEPLKIKRKAVKLYRILQRVSDLLCPVALGREDGLGSVKELVVLALEERWVRVGDVAG